MSLQVAALKENRAPKRSSRKAAQSSTKKTSKPSEKNSEFTQAELDQLIIEHRENGRKLARSLLRRWRARMNLEEVDSIVDLSLCETATRFSSEHGASFMTFFFYHLRGCLVRAVSTAVNNNNMVLLNTQRTGLDISDIAVVGSEDYKSFLPDCASFGYREVAGPESALLRKESIKSCREACEELDELEREVLVRSYENEEPLVDIAKSLGYSRCHISRVKKRALENLEALLGEKENEAATVISHGGMNIRISAASRMVSKRKRRREIKTTTKSFGNQRARQTKAA